MIQMKDVSFQYAEAERPSLRDVSVTIPDGQCVLLCGQSGCGKSTFTRLLNGLVPHYFEGELRGTVTVNGSNVTEDELYSTAKLVGSVFQNPRSQFFCVDTTSEIAFGCENMGLPEQEIQDRIREVTRELKMPQLLDQNIFELSGGEKQKVACASVSALRPPVMVLDEPTSNLDVHAIEDLRQTVALWKKMGKTVVIAEHRLYWLTEVCDRVLYLKDGEIALDIPMQQFREFSEDRLKQMGLRMLHGAAAPEKYIHCGDEQMELRNFFFSYDGADALRIPSLSLPKGGIIAVIGSNGAGKSTLTRCLCGLERKFKGDVVMDGKVLGRRARLKQCYMVMQDVNHQLFCESVEEEIQLGMCRDMENHVSEMMQAMDLENLADRHPMSLSGGEKQRVAIAAALLADKSILVFDEPTSGLDYRHMEQTGKVIASLAGKKTVLIVTHDLELICRCCTHVMQLEQGTVQDCYPMDENGVRRVLDFFMVHNKT